MNESIIDTLMETSKVSATLAADMLGDMLEQYMVAAYSAGLNSDMSNPNYSFAEKKAILMDFRTTVYPSLADKSEQEIFNGSEDLKFRVNITAIAN